jgi:hypothetical protein
MRQRERIGLRVGKPLRGSDEIPGFSGLTSSSNSLRAFAALGLTVRNSEAHAFLIRSADVNEEDQKMTQALTSDLIERSL